MTDIYEMHRKAFANVSAYIIVKDDQKVATVAFKYPADGAGRLYAYVHWLGLEMTRGYADGYGYDKHSAAVANAARKTKGGSAPKATQLAADDFLAVLNKDDGEYWYNRLRTAGFQVWEAV